MRTTTVKLAVRAIVIIAILFTVSAIRGRIDSYNAVKEIPDRTLLFVDFDRRIFRLDGGTFYGPIIVRGTNGHNGWMRNATIHASSSCCINIGEGATNWLISGCHIISDYWVPTMAIEFSSSEEGNQNL